jgi:carnitine-CoA ligase
VNKSDNWTIREAWGAAVDNYPSRLFLDVDGKVFSYQEFDDRVRYVASGLTSLGIGRGAVVATVLDNSGDSVACWLATTLIGAVYAPINTAYRGEYLRHQLDDSTAAVVIAESAYVERILEVAPGVGALHTIVCRHGVAQTLDQQLELIALSDLVNGSPRPLSVHDPEPGDLACLIYTAGTTGPSKACALSHGYVCHLAWQQLECTRRQPDELNWTALPMFHFNALATTLLTSILIGGTSSLYPRFSLSRFWPEIERSGARVVNVLGAMASLIASMDDTPELLRCKGQLRVAVGAPFPPHIVERWKSRFGVELVGAVGYGTTEASYVTTSRLDIPSPPGSSGRIDPAFEVQIVDDNERFVPPGVPGEVVVRPLRPNVMFDGYWRRPAETTAALRNLWFHTGDIGKFDDRGWFYFVDRKKDYIRRKGENVSSYELESVFLQHPAIKEVAAHAVPSSLTEDEIKITAVLVVGAELSEESLCQWAIRRVPYFALPRYIEFRPELPKNKVGRALKFQLREEGCTPRTWDRDKSGLRFDKH